MFEDPARIGFRELRRRRESCSKVEVAVEAMALRLSRA